MPAATPLPLSLREIRPHRFSLEILLLFWALANLLPAIAVFCLTNYSTFQNREAEKTRKIGTMLDNLDRLKKACEPRQYFASQISRAEQYAGLPARDANLFQNRSGTKEVPEHLHRLFCRLKNHELLLLITSEADPGTARVFTDQMRSPGYPRPGLRAAREIIKEYYSLNSMPQQKSQKTDRKIFASIMKSVFGAYLDPLNADEDFSIGFSEKAGGNRLYTARRLIRDRHGRPVFSYLAVFSESQNVLQHSFQLARSALGGTGFDYSLKLQPAVPYPFVYEQPDGSLRLTGPVAIDLLTSGFFRGRDLLSSLIKRGIMRHRPALYPHYEIRAAKESLVHDEPSIKPGFLIFIFLCLSLLLLRSFHQNSNIKASIRTRLFVSVLLATVLPASTFIFYLHRHVNRDYLWRQNQVGVKLKSHLQQLELAVKSSDHAHYLKFQGFIDRLRAIACTASESELKNILRNSLDKTFSGVGILRNDGMMLEYLDYSKVYVVKLEKKLQLSREFVFASMLRFFQFMKMLPDSLSKRLQQSSRGKKLLAMAEFFPPIDIDNFCSYEGTSQASKQDFGNYRMMSYKFLPPPKGGEPHGAVMMLIQDIRELAHLIIDDFAGRWSFFRQTTEEGTIETSILSCFDLNSTIPDPTRVWPSPSVLDGNYMAMAHLLSTGRAEIEKVSYEPDGTPVIRAARKIAGYPLIAFAECKMQLLASQKSMTFLIIGGNLLYIFLLLSILASILSELVTPPIETLLTAAQLTGEGQLVEIRNSFSNELSHLTTEFNKMNQEVKERERLERFISAEAVATIASEISNQVEIASKKVQRTIVFIHIRHFNSHLTTLVPENLFSLLNTYFPFVEDRINAEGGQIDKYIGDAIMAVFSDEDATRGSLRACRAVRAIMAELPDLNSSLRLSGLPEIVIGSGVASGEVISGRIGSYQSRLDYTVIGDTVNLAARLEAASHFDNSAHILIDEKTWQAAKNAFSCIFHGEIAIKGKAQPVKTYEIII